MPKKRNENNYCGSWWISPPSWNGGIYDDSSGFRSTNTYFFNSGLDSLLSIVQMPKGIPVSTFAVGKSGAINAALKTISILALNDAALKKFN